MTNHRRCFKLTDAQGQSYGGTPWGPGVTHRASGEGELCSSGWLHFYDDPIVAVLLNPIHADFQEPRLWLAEWGGRRQEDRGLKAGATILTTIEELDVPVVSNTQRIAFGILCAMEVCTNPVWRDWAEKWVSGEDRTVATARAASYASYSAATYASTAFTASYASYAADAAAGAARAAAYAADAASARAAATYAAYAAELDLPMLAARALTLGEQP